MSDIVNDATDLRTSLGVGNKGAFVGKSVNELQVENQELQEQNLRDPLTGLSNFRALENWMTHDDERFKKISTNVEKRGTGEIFPHWGLIMLVDADGLHDANETGGYKKGDKLLKDIAQACLETAKRETDICFRRGDKSDEFVIILPGEVGENTKKLVEKFETTLSQISNGESSASMATGTYGVKKSAKDTFEVLSQSLTQKKKERQVRGSHVETIYI